MVATFVCLCLCVVLVTGNPLAQLLPILSWQNGNQNIYNNPSGHLPFLQQPVNHNGLYPQQLTSNNNHNLQQFIAQNQIPTKKCPCNQYLPQNPTQVAPIDNAISQQYLNKLLTNPKNSVLQKFFDPNTRFYNQNGMEITIPKNLPNNGPTPNIINNYFILPPEYLETIEQDVNRNHKLPRNFQEENHIPVNGGNRKKIVNNNRREHKGNMNSEQPKPKRREPNREEVNKHKTGRKDEKIGSQKEVASKNNFKSTNKKNMRNRNENKNDKSLDKTYDSDDWSEENQIKRLKNKRRYQNGHNNSRKDRDESVIKEIHRKFPGIPEKVIKNLLTYIKRQLQNDRLGKINYSKNHPVRGNKTPQRSNRKNRNKKYEKNGSASSPSNEIIEQTTAITDSNLYSTTLTTTEQVQNYDNTTDMSSEDQERISHVTEAIEIDESTPKQIENNLKLIEVETTTFNDLNTLPNLGEEDTIEDIENFVDDYYPNFILDNIHNESEEDYIRNHRDNRYFYRIDRKNAGQTKSRLDELKTKTPTSLYEYEETLTKPLNEMNEDLNYNNDKDIFRPPPLLENPDFQTKQINKKTLEIDENQYSQQDSKHKDIYLENPNDKLSSYSNAKYSRFDDSKNIKPQSKKPKNVDIETVYARSKVVKYGRNPDSYEEITTDKYNLSFDNKPVIVYAKTLSSGENW